MPVSLSREWQNDLCLRSWKLGTRSGDCFHFIIVDGKVQCRYIPELKSNDEEVDYKIVIAIYRSTRVGDMILEEGKESINKVKYC